MLGSCANNVQAVEPAHDFTVTADFFDGRTDFHEDNDVHVLC
jgi:hypothetical protein